LVHLIPIPPSYARAFMTRFREVSVSVLVGNLGVAAFHGVLAGVGCWILGVPAPLIVAIVTGLFSFVPTVGVALVWIPMTIYLLVSAGWPRSLAFLGYGVVVIG